jgi:hypothetical protein
VKIKKSLRIKLDFVKTATVMGPKESRGKSAGVSATSGNSPPFTLKQAAQYGRAAYSPAEVAASCGRHPSWAYRLLYANKLKAVTELGRILIPASELERVLSHAGPYNPEPKPTARRGEKESNRRDWAAENKTPFCICPWSLGAATCAKNQRYGRG